MLTVTEQPASTVLPTKPQSANLAIPDSTRRTFLVFKNSALVTTVVVQPRPPVLQTTQLNVKVVILNSTCQETRVFKNDALARTETAQQVVYVKLITPKNAVHAIPGTIFPEVLVSKISALV